MDSAQGSVAPERKALVLFVAGAACFATGLGALYRVIAINVGMGNYADSTGTGSSIPTSDFVVAVLAILLLALGISSVGVALWILGPGGRAWAFKHRPRSRWNWAVLVLVLAGFSLIGVAERGVARAGYWDSVLVELPPTLIWPFATFSAGVFAFLGGLLMGWWGMRDAAQPEAPRPRSTFYEWNMNLRARRPVVYVVWRTFFIFAAELPFLLFMMRGQHLVLALTLAGFMGVLLGSLTWFELFKEGAFRKSGRLE